MSAPFPYEQLIASKLEQLPALPEMADVIWMRITAELDTDLPFDDDGFDDPDDGNDPGTAPAGAGPATIDRGWYFLLLLAGVAFFLLSQFDHPAESTLPDPISEPVSVPPISTPAPVPTNAGSPTAPDPEGNRIRKGGEKALPLSIDSGSHSPFPVSDKAPDSIVGSAINELTGRSDNARLDSVSTTPPITNRDSIGGRKRPTGIKGINPDDYRVVPQKEKKDSS